MKNRKYYTIENLKEINPSYDRDHIIEQYDVNKVNRLIDIIERNSFGYKPRPGDIIECYNPDDTSIKYLNGHLEEIDYMNKFGFHICTDPYVSFTEEVRGKPVFNTSGGYWFTETDLEKFQVKEQRLKTFGTWGHNGMCANGQIQFKAYVYVWTYVNKRIY